MNDSPCLLLSGRALLATLSLLSVSLGLGGCSKAPEEVQAAKVVELARSTGILLVQTNRPGATLEVTSLTASGEAPPAVARGPVNQPLTGLTPGSYAVVVSAEGWPNLSGAVDVIAGQTTTVTLNFKSGSLRLDSVPGGATVKHGGNVLGQTPLVLFDLPVGECQLTLEYPAWPALAFTTTITENVESTATARLPHGSLTVQSFPAGAAVQLDGKPVGQTPLTLAPLPAGPKKLRFQHPDFPTLLLSTTVEDRGEAKVALELATGFPPLDPAALLRAVWVPDDPNQIAPRFDAIGRYEPDNGIVKNLHRKKLFDDWLRRKYRFTGTVKSFDARKGEVEFVEQNGELARYRVLARLSPAALGGLGLTPASAKGVTLALYGELTAVEEPRWPAKVITLELTAAELQQAAPPAAP